ncbi:hypothetical protein O206_20405 [Ochrobactrum sp. EGD-AQ16]|nr:hypothetical protein O206_20405 [Ochrobactrum sp. EGD-AQ16]
MAGRDICLYTTYSQRQTTAWQLLEIAEWPKDAVLFATC